MAAVSASIGSKNRQRGHHGASIHRRSCLHADGFIRAYPSPAGSMGARDAPAPLVRGRVAVRCLYVNRTGVVLWTACLRAHVPRRVEVAARMDGAALSAFASRVLLFDDRSAMRRSRCCHGPMRWCWLDPLLQIMIPKRLGCGPDTGATSRFGGNRRSTPQPIWLAHGPIRPTLSGLGTGLSGLRPKPLQTTHFSDSRNRPDFRDSIQERPAMELGGLEPPTSWVRSRRSPN